MLEPHRVAQLVAKHLKSAADAHDRRSGPGRSGDLLGQSFGPQVTQACRRVRAAREDDGVEALQGRAGPDRRDRHARRVDEWIELVEVACVGE